MTTRADHKNLRDRVIARLRTSGLDVEAASDDREGDVAGLLGVTVAVCAAADRAEAIAVLRRITAASGPGAVTAVVTRSRDRGDEDPLAFLRLSDLVRLLQEFSPDSDTHRRLDPTPPLPVREPSNWCATCGLPITGRKATAVYCSKACKDRSFHLHRQAARSGALTGAP